MTLPPGRARLATRPLPTGSGAIAKTMGMTAVACFNVGTASPDVTMTSTFSRANSAAISATRSGRPSAQRYRSRWCDPRSSRVHSVAPQKRPFLDSSVRVRA